jgi:hypothetical protein
MGTHMKTTLDISDPLFKSAKALAQQSQTTLRALVEEGLRRVLSDAPGKVKPAFQLQDASVGGGQILITDPRQWQQMEEDHIAARTMKPGA